MFRSCFLKGKKSCNSSPPKKKNIPMNIISTHIVPKKPRTIENIRQIAIMALLSKEFKNEYLPELRKLKTQKNMSNYLSSLNYSMFRRGEYRPRFYNPNTGRLESGYPKPYNVARKLVRVNSVFSTKRTRNLSKRMNQRNNAINAIKRAPKQMISKSIGAGRTNITFKTIPNGKVYTWGSNKTLNGLNLGVPYKNVKIRNIFTRQNRKR
jgi:hypothetical protein